MSLHKPTVFKGAATALITPFRDGKIDRPALEALIEFQIAGGIAAILVAGTTGESATLDFDEHRELIRMAHESIAGRIPLLAGCGSNCTDRAVRLAEIATQAGADALLAVTPYYNKASDRGILAHYRMTLTAAHYRELAKIDRVCAVKEASGDLGLLEQAIAECGDDLDFYTGNDDRTVAAMKLGARGVISVASNVLPERMCELCRLCDEENDRRAAQKMQELRPILRELSAEVNPIPVKYAAFLCGFCLPEYRLPLTPPAPDLCRRLEKLFP